MATGDYHYTALAVARGVGMIPRQGKVIIIQKEVEARPADQNILTQADKAVCPSHLNSKAGSVAPKPSSFRSVPGKATQTGSLAHQVTHSVSFATGLAAARGQEQEELLERHIVQDTLGTMHLQSQHQTSDGGLAYIPQEPCSISFTRSRHAGSSSEYQGLLFQVDNGSAAQDDALQALTSIAQVLPAPLHPVASMHIIAYASHMGKQPVNCMTL